MFVSSKKMQKKSSEHKTKRYIEKQRLILSDEQIRYTKKREVFTVSGSMY